MATKTPGPPKRLKEVDRRSKDPIPAFTEESAERTEVTFAPVFDDLEPAETTDKNEVPKLDRKLRLPMPGESDEPPAERAPKAKPAEPARPKPIPVSPLPRSDREEEHVPVSVFAAKPSGSGNLLFGIVGVLLIVVMVAFAVAPDGKSDRELRAQQAAEHRRAYENLLRDRATITVGGGDSEGGGPEVAAQPEWKPRERPPAIVPVLKRRGHEVVAAVDPKDVRLGIEPAADRGVRREYDNYDSAIDRGNGIPMLMVFSKPPGMSVDVDGKLLGMTPLLRPLAKDTKRVKLRVYGAGYREWSETVSPNEIEQFKVGVTMEPISK